MPGKKREAPRIRYEYNPHLSTVLRSATETAEADKLPELLATARQRALSAEEAKLLAGALLLHEPWLEWSGKREKKSRGSENLCVALAGTLHAGRL